MKYKIYLKNEYDAQKQTLINTFEHHEELNERYNTAMRSNKEYEKRDLKQQVIIAMTQKELAETRLRLQTQRQTPDQTQTQPVMTDPKDQQRSTTPPLPTNNDEPTGNKLSPKLPDADEYWGEREKLDSFIISLKIKLNGNADWFLTLYVKLIYSMLKLKGRASTLA